MGKLLNVVLTSGAEPVARSCSKLLKPDAMECGHRKEFVSPAGFPSCRRCQTGAASVKSKTERSVVPRAVHRQPEWEGSRC